MPINLAKKQKTGLVPNLLDAYESYDVHQDVATPGDFMT